MIDPSKRFITLVLGLGVAVLLVAIVIGEHMGDRVLGTAIAQRTATVQAIAITPEPAPESPVPYGPNWKRSQALAAAGDPGFPDPRIPPKPLPTPPKATPTPQIVPTPRVTYNPNIPIWRQQPLPTASPVSAVSPVPTASPVDGPSAVPP